MSAYQLRIDRWAVRFRGGTDFGTGTVRLWPAEGARGRVEEVYGRARLVATGWPGRRAAHWAVSRPGHPHRRGGATSLRYAVREEADGAVSGYALYRHTSVPDGAGARTRWWRWWSWRRCRSRRTGVVAVPGRDRW
ncbi:hypothetical protein ACWDR5_29825 [Streptomyces koyangensis]